MTTHLVIADQDTLTRILVVATVLTVADKPLPWRPIVTDVKAWKHRDTGDRWLFRTPDSVAIEDYARCDGNVFSQGPPTGLRNGYRLPLIAAADLLGVDEL